MIIPKAEDMKIIHNKAEFLAFYHYDNKKHARLPSYYPCIVEKINVDGGLGGDCVEHRITYFPNRAGRVLTERLRLLRKISDEIKGIEQRAFFEGYKAAR